MNNTAPTSTVKQLPAGTWQLDPTKSTVTITVKKLGFITVNGTLSINTAAIHIDETGSVTAVDVALNAASYDSANPKRDEHVLSDDFLAASTHPTISFTSNKVNASGNDFTAAGTVTIKGKQSPVTLKVSNVTFDDTKGSFSASADVDRRALGIDKIPNFVIGQNLALSIDAVANKGA